MSAKADVDAEGKAVKPQRYGDPVHRLMKGVCGQGTKNGLAERLYLFLIHDLGSAPMPAGPTRYVMKAPFSWLGPLATSLTPRRECFCLPLAATSVPEAGGLSWSVAQLCPNDRRFQDAL
ncbi:hypothetical protein [Sphingobium yanoikuyae]|uniref:hypothetical protein n=1 Tax=Sphingobium yanoikuyae TaxID=13690 RepID=UPI0028ADF489|nr:hypothetical protein [Sphingobium yanoikuyae]